MSFWSGLVPLAKPSQTRLGSSIERRTWEDLIASLIFNYYAWVPKTCENAKWAFAFFTFVSLGLSLNKDGGSEIKPRAHPSIEREKREGLVLFGLVSLRINESLLCLTLSDSFVHSFHPLLSSLLSISLKWRHFLVLAITLPPLSIILTAGRSLFFFFAPICFADQNSF